MRGRLRANRESCRTIDYANLGTPAKSRRLATPRRRPSSCKEMKNRTGTRDQHEEDVFLQKIENVMANACRGFIMPTAISGSVGDIQSPRTEMKEDITRVQTQLTEVFNSAMEQMQVEADRRTAVALERLVQQVQDASKQANNDGTTARTAHAVLSEKTQRSLRDETKEDIAGVQVQLTEVLNVATEKMQRESIGKQK
jgi:hypothetical protein